MITYKISLFEKDNSILIESTDLFYLEACGGHGLQCDAINQTNYEEIKDKCLQVANLIKEINTLNL